MPHGGTNPGSKECQLFATMLCQSQASHYKPLSPTTSSDSSKHPHPNGWIQYPYQDTAKQMSTTEPALMCNQWFCFPYRHWLRLWLIHSYLLKTNSVYLDVNAHSWTVVHPSRCVIGLLRTRAVNHNRKDGWYGSCHMAMGTVPAESSTKGSCHCNKLKINRIMPCIDGHVQRSYEYYW